MLSPQINKLCLYQMVQFCYIKCFLILGARILEGPSNFIVIPPATEAVFSCILTEGALPSWRINGVFFLRSDLLPAGHILDGNNLNVSIPVNGTEYVCLITFLNGTVVGSDPALLYIAGMYMCLCTIADGILLLFIFGYIFNLHIYYIISYSVITLGG